MFQFIQDIDYIRQGLYHVYDWFRAGLGLSDTPISGWTAVNSDRGRSSSDETTPTKPFPGLQARVALEALRGEKTLAELAAQHDVHANQITTWRTELLGRAAEIFGNGSSAPPQSQEKIRELHEKIGELTVERDFLERTLGRFPAPSGKR